MRNAKTVAIIGSGVAGLATAKCLLKKGYSCTVFERRSELGGVWADGYAEFGVQIQRELYQFPDFPLPDDAKDFTAGPAFRRYLEEYCDRFGIRDCLKLGVEVVSVDPDRSKGWTLVTESEGKIEKAQADFLVVATGLYSEAPTLPDIPGKSGFPGQILHSSDVKDFEMLREKRVAVVGYGKSAADIAMGATHIASSVHLVFRTAHWPVPRKLLGILPFKWGMLTRLTASLIPPYVRPTPAVRLLHTIGKPLPWLFWRVVEILLRAQQKLDTRIENGKTLVPEHDVIFDAYSERTMVPRPGFFDLIRKRRIIAHRSSIECFDEERLVLSDGTSVEADCVVFGTGWETNYSFLTEAIKTNLHEEADGLYLYRHVLHPKLPNLAFVGRVSTFMSVTTYALQARWLAEVLSGGVALPSSENMEVAISNLKAWKRSWMPDGPARSGTLLLHMAHYHDELLRDLGEDPLRKRGLMAPLKEVLAPYQASDFRDVV